MFGKKINSKHLTKLDTIILWLNENLFWYLDFLEFAICLVEGEFKLLERVLLIFPRHFLPRSLFTIGPELYLQGHSISNLYWRAADLS